MEVPETMKLGPLVVSGPVARVHVEKVQNAKKKDTSGEACVFRVQRLAPEDPDAGLDLDVQYLICRNGEDFVRVSAVREGPARLQGLMQRLRLSIERDRSVSWMRLKLALVDPDSENERSQHYKATIEKLGRATGLACSTLLGELGAMDVAHLRELDLLSKRTDDLVVTFAHDDMRVPVAGYVLCTVIPVWRGCEKD